VRGERAVELRNQRHAVRETKLAPIDASAQS